jgi:hypothetical protein
MAKIKHTKRVAKEEKPRKQRDKRPTALSYIHKKAKRLEKRIREIEKENKNDYPNFQSSYLLYNVSSWEKQAFDRNNIVRLETGNLRNFLDYVVTEKDEGKTMFMIINEYISNYQHNFYNKEHRPEIYESEIEEMDESDDEVIPVKPGKREVTQPPIVIESDDEGGN